MRHGIKSVAPSQAPSPSSLPGPDGLREIPDAASAWRAGYFLGRRGYTLPAPARWTEAYRAGYAIGMNVGREELADELAAMHERTIGIMEDEWMMPDEIPGDWQAYAEARTASPFVEARD